ncbi:MAG TPA: caspase family protein [Stellaceae bacterium]|jgi:hypothetical protein|nr:caspase family protein [Stellaceae bacterium]
MKFRALIIGNPGEDGADNYCAGVLKDFAFYPQFLASALGGAWEPDEITVLHRPSTLKASIALLELASADYSITIFSGHGYTNSEDGAFMLELKDGHEIDARELRAYGAPKRTVILDCCRQVARVVVKEERLFKALAKKAELDPEQCRSFYERRLDECARGLVVQYACAPGEVSNDSSAVGGYYSSSLLLGAREWADANSSDLSTTAHFFSVVNAHKTADELVKQLTDGQNPQIDKPRSGPYFPFGVAA